jgi:NADH-quinone oxidoreductase subunit C
MNVEPRFVELNEWSSTWATAHDEGFTQLDFLTAIDRLTHIEVIGRVVSADGHRFYAVEVADDLPSIAGTFPSATWQQREIAEMFGLLIDGQVPEPLLTRVSDPALLRKTAPLAARVEKPWPGVGKRGRKPGVLDTWQEQ